MSHRDLDADQRANPDPYTVQQQLLGTLGSGPGFPHEPPRRRAVDAADLGPRPWYGSRRTLVGLALVCGAVLVWAVLALVSASRDSDVRTLGDFKASARVIQNPSGGRQLVNVAAIEAVVPFPILIPAAIEAESVAVTAYVRPPWRRNVAEADATYLVIEFRTGRGVLRLVQHRGIMDVVDIFRDPGLLPPPASYRIRSTATDTLSDDSGTTVEVPAADGGTILVLEWGACGHGLALAALASEYPEDELIRIAESVPEQCN